MAALGKRRSDVAATEGRVDVESVDADAGYICPAGDRIVLWTSNAASKGVDGLMIREKM